MRPTPKSLSTGAACVAASSLAAAAALVSLSAHADEGMWPFNMAPVADVNEKYGFEMTQPWLDQVMRSSVRFNNGGSGSFVSSKGLVMTNHHVGADCIQKLSQGDADTMRDGFVATTVADEQKCPDLELNQLTSIADVTERITAAGEGAADDAAKQKAKKAEMAKVEQACSEETKLRCDVVTLYSGGAYHLYRYQKYTDVRLAFAPEAQSAFFGGDQDNFTYPRMCLDVAFFRVYVDGAPLDTTDNHLPFAKDGATRGQLVFVSGNPGSTGRFSTTAELLHLRDRYYPFIVERLKKNRDRLVTFMAQSDENGRVAQKDLHQVENSIKALTGYLEGLKDPALMTEAERRQADVRSKLSGLDAAERARIEEAWPKLEAAYGTYGSFYSQHLVTERYFAPGGQLADIARHLVRMADELPKPSEERLREYRDSNLKSVELALFSEAPIADELEVLKLTMGLEAMREVLGADHKVVKAALAGQTPEARARAAVSGTNLRDIATRQKIRDGGKLALGAAKDPMIQLVQTYDKLALELRKRHEDEVEAVVRAYAGRIAEAWAKAYGTSVYPDATFTPRIAVGVVKGYDKGDERVAWRTQVGDLFRRHKRAGGEEPYELPQRWLDAVARLDFTTPMNFVSTNDIIGGNSGSPVFNTDGQVVGLIFDGNLAMLPNRFVYRDQEARAISVHSRAIVHALDRVYRADRLVRELGF